MKNSSANRMTITLNGDYDLSKWVKAGIQMNISRNYYDNVPLGTMSNEGAALISSAGRFEPYLPIRDENGEYTKSLIYTLTPNPVSLLDIVDNTTKDRVIGSAYVQAQPIENLFLKANFGFDRRGARRKAYYPSTIVGTNHSKNGIGHQVQDDGMDYLANFTANYLKTIGDHSFTALAGWEFNRLTSEWFRAGNTDFPMDGFLYNNLGVGSGSKDVASSANQREMASVFGRLNYAYLGRYMLTATLRADGASNFHPDNRWGYFPSVSGAWRFSDEAFMSSTKDVFSNGKLRLGYGQTGNSNVGNRTLDYFSEGASYAFGNTGATGMALNELGNPKLKWETTTEWNIGLDLGFLNNRINLTTEYYDRIVSDLLVTSKTLASYSELGSMAANIGKTRGRGLELTLNTVNIMRSDFVWTSDLTFYTYEDYWEERDPDWVPAPYESEKDPIRAVFRYRSDGLLQAGEAVPAWQKGLLPGQVKIKKLDNTEATTLGESDNEMIGVNTPDFTFGFNNTLRYKKFDLNIYFYGEVNRLHGPSYYDSWTPSIQQVANVGVFGGSIRSLDCWRGDNQGSVPSLLSGGHASDSDYFLKKVSFLRCRNITLGYLIPISKKVVNSFRVNVSVSNPFVITNYNGLDPETDYNLQSNIGNLNNYSYPNVRTYSVGVDINF